MILSLDVRRARKGDCFILHYGDKADPGLVVIDGGPSHVYTPQLKPRLTQIRKVRGLASDQPLPIDLLMVSHIDDDHINGVLELTKELVTAKDEKKPPAWKIRSLWHNSFDDIVGNSPKELLISVTASYGAAGLSGDLDSEGFDAHTAKVLASVEQGFRLRKDAEKLKIAVNKEFGGKLVMAGQSTALQIGNGLLFTVVGPMAAELIALQKKHDAFLAKPSRERAVLAAFTDKSVANLSSMVLLAEAQGKRILLTGDARGDKIVEGLERLKLLDGGGKMHVDILKVPHHGSDRNMEIGFFQRITADHYVFSGNGEHGNPERETLQMLMEARGSANYLVHLTYPVEQIDVAREANWEKERNKEIKRNNARIDGDVRELWSPDKHGLVSFLSSHEPFAKKIRVVPEDAAWVIDLHDKLGY